MKKTKKNFFQIYDFFKGRNQIGPGTEEEGNTIPPLKK